MKLNRIFFIGILLLISFSTISFSQDKEMKNDKMDHKMDKEKMKKEDKMMNKKDDMMKDDMTMKIDKDNNGVAIKGYDPVAYFMGKAEMGKSDYKYEWMGATWMFANEKDMKMFKENPHKYAPQYGGYCAYAVSKGALAPVDPTVYKVVNDKLYLNNSEKAAELWRKDIPGNIKKANQNWPKLNMSKEKDIMK